MTAGLYVKFVAGVIVAALIAYFVHMAYHWAYEQGANSVRIEFTAYKQKQAELHDQAEQAARDTEQEWNSRLSALLEKKNEENAVTERKLNDTLVQLRNRPERTTNSTGLPTAAEAGRGCTGAGLAGPDADFLAGYAADSARLQSAYNECTARYEDVRQKLQELQPNQSGQHDQGH